MAHKYRLLERPSSDELSDVVTERLANGWDLWGNPFVEVVGYERHVTDVHYFQAMVSFDPSGREVPAAPSAHAVAGKVETALGEPAGYNVQVPETPSMNDFHDLGAAIGSSFKHKEKVNGNGHRPIKSREI